MKRFLLVFGFLSCFAFGQVQGPRTGVPAGTATNPGLFFNGDTNTGIFSPGADQLNLVTGGVTGLNIGSGQVSTFANNVIVNGGAGFGLALFKNTGAALFLSGNTSSTLIGTSIQTNSTGDTLFLNGNGTQTQKAALSNAGFLTLSNAKLSPNSAASSEWIYNASSGASVLNIDTDVDYAVQGIYGYNAVVLSNGGNGHFSGSFGYIGYMPAGPVFVGNTSGSYGLLSIINNAGKVRFQFTCSGGTNCFVQLRISGRAT
jgi:hypothetical protein